MGGGGGPSTVSSNSLSNLLSTLSSNFSGQSSTNAFSHPYAAPYAEQLLNAYSGLAMPGGSIAASPYAYQEVAPWTVPQMQAAQAIGSFGGSSPLIGGAEQQQAKTIAGQYLDPATNPQLTNYYNAAADALTQQYKYATDPSLLAKGAQTGTLVSSPMVQQNQLARYNLGQNLANLAAGIYEPAYQAERQLQQGASQGTPNLVQGQYIPANNLMNLGQQEQAQAQNVLNSATQNLTQLGLWPYQALNMYGSAIGGVGPSLGGTSGSTTVGSGSSSSTGTQQGTGTVTQPNPQQTAK